MRGKRGITLVSLVVTIIVLIILAGVSINLTLGENGIITIAKKARENMELATIDEETKLNALYTQIELEDENIGGIDNSSISKLIEFKQKVASAITDMGIETLETANADTMANNIRNLTGVSSADKVSYDNTNSGLTATNVQGAVDELKYSSIPLITNDNYILLDETVSHNSSYTVQESGLYFLQSTSIGGTGATWYIDSARTKTIATSGLGDNNVNNINFSFIPIKAGTTIYTRNVSGTKYKVYGYIPIN